MTTDDQNEINEWDAELLEAIIQITDEVEASRNLTQNPTSTHPNPDPPLSTSPLPDRSLHPPSANGGLNCDYLAVLGGSYSPPRELSQRPPESIIVTYGSQAIRAPVHENYGERGGGRCTNKRDRYRDREIERLKSELERTSKELRIKERECKELQRDRDKKDEQLKDASFHVENKDEICRLNGTNLTNLPKGKDVQSYVQSVLPELKSQIKVDNGLPSSSGRTIQESCLHKSTAQSKHSRAMGVQTDIAQEGGPSESKKGPSLEYDLSRKLNAIWGFPGAKMLGRNLISELFGTFSADFCSLFKCMSFPLKSNPDSWPNRNINDEALHEGLNSPQLVDAAKVSRLYEILMKVHHEEAPLQTLLEALFDVCRLENAVAAHQSLHLLRAILQHLSSSTRLDKRINVVVDQPRNNFTEGQSVGQEKHDKSETTSLMYIDLENLFNNEDRISRTSTYLSAETLILIFEKMQQIAVCNTEEYLQAEALSIMNLTLMASIPSEKEQFGLVQLLESLPQFLRKGVGFAVRKEAVHLLFLVLNSPKMLSMLCDWQRDVNDHAKASDCLINTSTLQGNINFILEGLAECLACDGANAQELKLQRDVIVMLAFIASSGKSGFDILLYPRAPQGLNFLELIVRVLASEVYRGKANITKSQTCKERISLAREALILFNRLASNPAYSKATLGVLTTGATASLTIDVANRMSTRSWSLRKHSGTSKLHVEDEIVDLARLFKARVFTFLGETNP